MSNRTSNEKVADGRGGDKALETHLYIVVACKTESCRAAHVLTYLGEKGNTPATVEYWMSYPLMIDCPTCGRTYDYSDSEDKFRQEELPLAPPSGYFNRLALPEFVNAPPAAAS